jgi:DNA-nicking Smr family endonuclease
MARNKKRKHRIRESEGRGPREAPFNPALKGVTRWKEEKETIREPHGEPVHPSSAQDIDEMAEFREAMAGVTPLKGSWQRVAKIPDQNTRPVHPPNAGDLEVMAHLSDLVSGIAEMDIAFSDEYIEGSVKGFDRKLMQKLKRGLFPIQDHVDLHGCTRQDAELRVTEFLLKSHRLGLRCVLVVHGRGLNSEDHIPILKERLPVWLNRGPVKKIVLAFSTARSYDGGTGAIYILLRRPRGRF